MPEVNVQMSAMDALLQASPIVQITLLILIGLSIFCWAIAYSKWQLFKNLNLANELFLINIAKAVVLEYSKQHILK